MEQKELVHVNGIACDYELARSNSEAEEVFDDLLFCLAEGEGAL
jgi:hypothetical protein